jgi:hypothetical protein
MAGVIDRLTKAGYLDTFRAEKGGVCALHAGHLHAPEDLVVESIDRFEGISDPSDEAMVMALRCSVDGCRGTYTVPYGKNMPAIDAEMVARLPDARRLT